MSRSGSPSISWRSPSARVATAALVAAYVVTVLRMPRMAETDEIITRCPRRWSRKISMAASVCARAATKLVIAVCRLAS
jgi:hypothetical protein